jgi:hypothetical protein
VTAGLDGGAMNRIVPCTAAMMEVKSAMGVIVAAPTAGACAALPGAARAVAERMPREPRCTALGGLSVTPTSLAIKQRLAERKACGCRRCP